MAGRHDSGDDHQYFAGVLSRKLLGSDGLFILFPSRGQEDGSAILVKVWTGNGTIQTVRYIPEQVQQSSQPEENSNEEILKRLDSMEQTLNSLTDSLTN